MNEPTVADLQLKLIEAEYIIKEMEKSRDYWRDSSQKWQDRAFDELNKRAEAITELARLINK